MLSKKLATQDAILPTYMTEYSMLLITFLHVSTVGSVELSQVGLECLLSDLSCKCLSSWDVALLSRWYGGRHLASGSEGPGFESWLSQVDVESLGKALYMNFPHPTHV